MPDLLPPRVSILIPNFNNGVESSKDGTTNLILDLLTSLEQTLRTETQPFEILVYDDGSSDDSLETLRQWSKKTWSNGTAFLTLIENEHCGILSITANKLSRMAKGDILARLDGDVFCLTPNWVSKLIAHMDQNIPNLGIIGPKQLKPTLMIHSYGDFLIHPHGYVHIAGGMPRHSVKRTLEVDHVMGCFYCIKKEVFEDLGGYDENFLRGQTVDFGLRARKAGWRAFAVPDIEFVHNHVGRKDRDTKADSKEGVYQTLDTFEEKWGFNRLVPDMEWIAKKYEGSPILWNKVFFGDQAYKPRKIPASEIDFNQTEWANFANNQTFQTKINLRLVACFDVIKQVKIIPNPLVILGIGDGLVTHLIANQGGHVLAFDERAGHVEFANKCLQNQTYPLKRPTIQTLDQADKTNLPDASVDQILIDRILERHLNPTRILLEAARILKPEHYLVIVSDRKQFVPGEDHSDPATLVKTMTTHRSFAWFELINFIKATRLFNIAMDISTDDQTRDIVLIVKRTANEDDESQD